MSQDLITMREASEWASEYTHKKISESNISYLVQYGRLQKFANNGSTLVSLIELRHYYDSYRGRREISWKERLGNDLNWSLSFDNLREKDTTKHVHRLHPYKGKFIPQLVEYFLDQHTDAFKKETYFGPGDIVLDPFCGSGTTLVQANELGMHAIGIDVSAFNAHIANAKIRQYDLKDVYTRTRLISQKLREYLTDSHVIEFDERLADALSAFNSQFFPSPDFKRKVAKNEIDEDQQGAEKLKRFLPVYESLIKEYKIKLQQEKEPGFLGTWYLASIRDEIDYVFGLVKQISDSSTKKIVSVIFSRTIRSCRATTHSDLATLKEPVLQPYYCAKHGKICKPLFSILSWWERYTEDTIVRLSEFEKLRTETYQHCLIGDSRSIDIISEIEKRSSIFAKEIRKKKITGIFSSPPYVGLIDYHEQHAYAYDLFGFKRRDELEIGKMNLGQGKEAQASYVDGITAVLNNCKKYLAKDYHVFLIANDKFNLYPRIADKAGMRIVNTFKRPVLNRTERDKGAYSEMIFDLVGEAE